MVRPSSPGLATDQLHINNTHPQPTQMRINLTDSDLSALVTEAANRGFRTMQGENSEMRMLLLKSRISLGKAQQEKAQLALIDQLTAESQALTERINQLQQQLAN